MATRQRHRSRPRYDHSIQVSIQFESVLRAVQFFIIVSCIPDPVTVVHLVAPRCSCYNVKKTHTCALVTQDSMLNSITLYSV